MTSTVILFFAVFAASAVQAVETLTIVLAVRVTRGGALRPVDQV